MAARPDGASPAPGKREIAGLFGRASALWKTLRDDLSSQYGLLDETWSFSRKTNHWALQLRERKKKRTVLYLIPLPGSFQAAFALGEKACTAARAGTLRPRSSTSSSTRRSARKVEACASTCARGGTSST